MKKILTYALLLIFLLSSPATVFAAGTKVTKITEGYTSDHVYYEAYDTICFQDSETITVTEEVTYHNRVVPPNKMAYEATIDNITYSGTLYLITFIYNSEANQTISTYKAPSPPSSPRRIRGKKAFRTAAIPS